MLAFGVFFLGEGGQAAAQVFQGRGGFFSLVMLKIHLDVVWFSLL